MATKTYSGVEVEIDEDGHLAKKDQWTRDIAQAMAQEEGIESLNDRHWIVVDFMRKIYEEAGSSPSLRKINKESGVHTKELYELFPKGPAKKAAKISGLPKPKGCI